MVRRLLFDLLPGPLPKDTRRTNGNYAMTIARLGSLTKSDGLDFQSDLAAVHQGMDRIVASARKASEDGEAFVLEQRQSRSVLEAISLADAGEKTLSGYKSLLVYLWFKGRGDLAIGKHESESYLPGCCLDATSTVEKLRLTGKVRWAYFLRGLSLELFSDRAVRSLRAIPDDLDEMARKHQEILDGYHGDRERIEHENKGGSSRYQKALPKFITDDRVQRCLGTDQVRNALRTPAGAVKPDSAQSAAIDDGDGVDDLGRVRLRLSEAEDAVEILAGRLSRQKDVQALKLAVHRVADQARAIQLSHEQANALWADRQ